MQVLIVEDDAATRNALEILVREMGHGVCWAASREAAIGLLDSERIDLIVLDLAIESDGWDIVRYAHMRPTTKTVPVIAVVGRSEGDPAIRRNMLESAAVFLWKPAEVILFERAIRAVGEGTAMAQRAACF